MLDEGLECAAVESEAPDGPHVIRGLSVDGVE
jgi:hypothetical protein